LDREVTGDIENTCRYFMNKFANWCNLRPIAELIPLAAYTILAAGEENPHGIGGLEVYIVPTRRAAVRLNPTQEEELKVRFKKTAESIRDQLLQPFDYISGTA